MAKSVARRMLDKRKGYLKNSCFGDCCISTVEKQTIIKALRQHAKPRVWKRHFS